MQPVDYASEGREYLKGTAFKADPAVEEGRLAHHAGVDYHEGNPHPVYTGPWHHWRYGWRQGRDQRTERHD